MLTDFFDCDIRMDSHSQNRSCSPCTFRLVVRPLSPHVVRTTAYWGILSVWLVDPKLWDDSKFLSLNPIGRLAWLCILTGAGRTALPGLTTNFDALTLASSLRFEVTECTFAIRDLLERDMAQYDPAVRVLRVPRAPRYAICRNPNMLAGWYRLWNSVPDCSLKYDHIGSLAECVNFTNVSMVERWDRTFGRIQARLIGQTDGAPIQRVPLLDRMLGSQLGPKSEQEALPAATARPS